MPIANTILFLVKFKIWFLIIQYYSAILIIGMIQKCVLKKNALINHTISVIQAFVVIGLCLFVVLVVLGFCSV